VADNLQMPNAVITGAEPLAGDGSAQGALIQFYRAFNHARLDDLARNWAEGDVPSMDNPIGGIRRGWPEIRSGYERLFGGHARVTVALFDLSSQCGEDWHLLAASAASVKRRAAVSTCAFARPGRLPSEEGFGARCTTMAR
jgi:hypothetical protein